MIPKATLLWRFAHGAAVFGVRVHLLADRPEVAVAEARRLVEATEAQWQFTAGRFPVDHRRGARCLGHALEPRKGGRSRWRCCEETSRCRCRSSTSSDGRAPFALVGAPWMGGIVRE